MTAKHYNFLNNTRLIAIFILAVLILYYLFEIIVNHVVEFSTIGPAVGLLIPLANLIFNKPIPPPANPQI